MVNTELDRMVSKITQRIQQQGLDLQRTSKSSGQDETQ